MTTYFSRIRLNPTRPGTRRLLTSPQALHACVLGSHPGAIATDQTRVLWRVDQAAKHDIQLFVVSPSRPDFVGLIEQAGWPTDANWDITEYDTFLNRLTLGQHWRFRLTANPVEARKAKADSGSRRGGLVPQISVRYQEAWFRKRTEGWGFRLNAPSSDPVSLPQLRVENRQTSDFRRGQNADPTKGGRVAITRADFVGTLEVTNAELLRRHLVQGMGRAKAYGCGLMTLAPRS